MLLLTNENKTFVQTLSNHKAFKKLNIESMFHIYAFLQYICRVETMGILGRFWRVPRKQLLKEPGTRCKRPLDEPQVHLIPERR